MSVSKAKLKIILPVLLAVAIVATSIFVIVDKSILNDNTDEDTPVNVGYVSSEPSPDDTFVPELGTYVKDIPSNIRSAKITPGVDFLTDNLELQDIIAELDGLINNIKNDRFNAVNVVINTENIVLFEAEGITTEYGNVLSLIYNLAHSRNMTVITTVDLGLLADKNVADKQDVAKISKILSSESLISNTDMIMFDGYLTDDSVTADELSYAMKEFYISVIREDTSIYTGIAAEGFFKLNEDTDEQDAGYKFYNNGNADIKKWIAEYYTDFVFVSVPYPVDGTDLTFKNAVELWNNEFSETTDLYFEIAYSLYGSNENWKKTDIIVEELMILSDTDSLNFGFDSYSAFLNDQSESRPAVLKYLLGEIAGNYILKDLSVSAPTKTKFTTYENTVSLMGASDPEFGLTLNGEPLERTDLGYFSIDLYLDLGENVYTLEHKGVTKTFKITYKKVVIKEVSPESAQTINGGSSIVVNVVSLAGSTVTATLNGTTIDLMEEPILDDFGENTEYSNFKGIFVMPVVYDANKDLGKISFKSVSDYGTETKNGGKITVLKTELPDPEPDTPDAPVAPPLPEGGDYVDVGTSLIAEVIDDYAETFNIGDSDCSRPTNNYLPKGTVDYCSPNTTTSGSIVLRTLRYGRTVYSEHKGSAPIKTYKGTLPDHNEVGIASIDNSGKYTTITLDTLWKAPFLFDLKEQEYKRNNILDSNRDFTVSEITYSYIDITFTYATVATGNITFENNPIFKSGEWIKNTGDYTLRLFLNKTGAFYGWSASYNDNGQLVFSFLNPAKITEDTTNKYGYSLSGVTIVVDAGHGGNDPGSYGYIRDKIEINGEKVLVYEHYLNLLLAEKVKNELESMGATVILTRTDNDTTLNDLDRMAFARAQNPDFILSIHRNGSTSSSPNGFNTYHFNAYSSNAANLIYNATAEENLYPDMKEKYHNVWSGVKSHVFYMCRISDCPVVLTENGYMTNKENFESMIMPEFNDKCAVALAQGVLDYFISIQ